MLRNLILATFVVMIGVSAPAAEWTVENVGPGARPVLAVGDDGVVHISWAIEQPEESVYYARREPDGWETVVVTSGYFNNALDLCLDTDGRANIAFHDHDFGGAAHLAATTSGWEVNYVDHPGHDGWNPAIAVGADGAVHLASFDRAAGIEYAVIRRPSVEVEQVGTGPLEYGYGTTLALDGGGRPHLCYHDGDGSPPGNWDGSLYYAIREAGGWVTSVIDTGGDVGKFASLALDSRGVPHVAYLKRETSTTATVRYAVLNGATWIVEDVLHLESLSVGLSGAHRTVTLALDAQDRPHVAASDKTVIAYAVRTDAEWVVDTVAEQISPDHEYGQLASIDLDPEGRPHIAFFEEPSSGSSSIGTVYYARIPVRVIRAPKRPTGRISPGGGQRLR